MRNLLNIWCESAWNPSHLTLVCSSLHSFSLLFLKHRSWCCDLPYSKPSIAPTITLILKCISIFSLWLLVFLSVAFNLTSELFRKRIFVVFIYLSPVPNTVSEGVQEMFVGGGEEHFTFENMSRSGKIHADDTAGWPHRQTDPMFFFLLSQMLYH